MHLELTDDQAFFRDTTRKFLESEVPLDAVRSLYETAGGFDRAWWRQAAELGWTSLFVAVGQGGGSLSGRPAADAVIVAEEMGRLVSPGPFLPVNVVAAAVAWQGTEAQRDEILPSIVSGDRIATWAFAEQDRRWEADALTTSAVVDGDVVVVTGEKAFVEAAGLAETVLVTARADSGLTQVLVPADWPGVTITSGRSVDMTRRFGRIRFDGVRLPADSILGTPGDAGMSVARQLRLALALQCAEMVGLADRTLEFTLDYGRDRFAFGRPIVSFQALKHRIADMAVWLEGAKAVADALAAAVDEDDPEADRLASVAKAYVAEHCVDIIDDCVQITGGIGVTWEHDIHLYNRRAVVNRAVYGSPEEHKDRLVALLGGERS